MSFSLTDVRLVIPSVIVTGIAVVGFLLSTGSIQTADTMTLARSSCEVAIKGTPTMPIEPVSACDCIFKEIYPRLSEEAQNYFTDVYLRAEAGAPNSKYARAQFDSNLSDRLRSLVVVDSATNPAKGIRIARELDAVGKTQGLSTNCLQLTAR